MREIDGKETKQIDQSKWQACQRVTGKSVAEWESGWKRKRINSYRAGSLATSKVLDRYERDAMQRELDIPALAFETVVLKFVSHAVTVPVDWTDDGKLLFKVVTETSPGRIQVLESRCISQMKPDAPKVKAILAYRLTPQYLDTLRTESAEGGKRKLKPASATTASTHQNRLPVSLTANQTNHGPSASIS